MNNNKKFCKLNVVSIDKSIFFGLIKKIQISGYEGELGIYPYHSQLLSLIKPGMLLFLDSHNKKHFYYISGGIIEVQPKIVSILSDTIIRGIDLDLHAIVQKKKIIEQKMNCDDESNNKKLLIDLSYELAKLRVIDIIKKNNIKL